MFARIVEITPKLEKKEELMQTIRREILPILKKKPGFLELLPFFPEIAQARIVAISLWSGTRDAEQYVEREFPRVEEILKPFLELPLAVKTYKVETTFCKHFVEALTVTA